MVFEDDLWMLIQPLWCRVVWTVWISVIVEKFGIAFLFLCVCFYLVVEKSEERRETIKSLISASVYLTLICPTTRFLS